MNCPTCLKPTVVTDTRLVNGGRERKRVCAGNHVLYTQEVFIEKWNYKDPRRKRVIKPKKQARPKHLKKWKGLQITDTSPQWVRNIWEKTK